MAKFLIAGATMPSSAAEAGIASCEEAPETWVTDQRSGVGAADPTLAEVVVVAVHVKKTCEHRKISLLGHISSELLFGGRGGGNVGAKTSSEHWC